MAVIMLLALLCWFGTVMVICKRQRGVAALALIVLSLFLWPLALIISLCTGGKPPVQIIYNVTAAQLPTDFRQ
jgi:hypothetical protein